MNSCARGAHEEAHTSSADSRAAAVSDTRAVRVVRCHFAEFRGVLRGHQGIQARGGAGELLRVRASHNGVGGRGQDGAGPHEIALVQRLHGLGLGTGCVQFQLLFGHCVVDLVLAVGFIGDNAHVVLNGDRDIALGRRVRVRDVDVERFRRILGRDFEQEVLFFVVLRIRKFPGTVLHRQVVEEIHLAFHERQAAQGGRPAIGTGETLELSLEYGAVLLRRFQIHVAAISGLGHRLQQIFVEVIADTECAGRNAMARHVGRILGQCCGIRDAIGGFAIREQKNPVDRIRRQRLGHRLRRKRPSRMQSSGRARVQFLEQGLGAFFGRCRGQRAGLNDAGLAIEYHDAESVIGLQDVQGFGDCLFDAV